SAFAEWLRIRNESLLPYCVIALLTYTTVEKSLDPIKGIRYTGGASGRHRTCLGRADPPTP
ncbi:MAG: hypothetical protein WCP12_17950, partial [bacterium]